MHANRLVIATRAIRYIILAAIVAGAIRSGFFVSEGGADALVGMVLIWPFLIVAFGVFVVPWETKIKSTLTPFIALLVICVLLALPSLVQSLQILWR